MYYNKDKVILRYKLVLKILYIKIYCIRLMGILVYVLYERN